MLQPLCSLPEGEVGSVLGGGPGARLATPAGGLARGPSPGGGDRVGCPSLCGRRSRGGLWGEQSQPGVRGTGGRDRGQPPLPLTRAQGDPGPSECYQEHWLEGHAHRG